MRQAQASKTAHASNAFRHLLAENIAPTPRVGRQYGEPLAPPLRTRDPQVQWRKSLAGATILFVLGAQPALAATINVRGACTLGKAITTANTNRPVRGCVKGAVGPDTIVLPRRSRQALTTLYASPYGPSGLPPVRSSISLAGNGSSIIRAFNAPAFRILTIANTGNLRLQNVTISGGIARTGRNRFYSEGGGIYNDGVLRILNSTISNNRAVYSGGIENYGVLSLLNVTMSGNRATTGGAMYLNPASVTTITNTTITRNRATRAGGIFVGGDGQVDLIRALISGNTAADSPEIFAVGDILANNFNLFGHTGDAGVSGFTPGATDIVPTQPPAQILRPTLALNGGRNSNTHALVAGSPAIDAVSDGTCPPPANDQRGTVRPQDGNGDGGPACDIGAYELTAPLIPAPPPVPAPVEEEPDMGEDGGDGEMPDMGTSPEEPSEMAL